MTLSPGKIQDTMRCAEETLARFPYDRANIAQYREMLAAQLAAIDAAAGGQDADPQTLLPMLKLGTTIAARIVKTRICEVHGDDYLLTAPDIIDEDLRRRTFTSETVAYNPDSGIYDQFGGLRCITAEKTILCAIDEERFEELEHEQANRKKKPKEAPKKIVIDAIRENPECILIAMQKYARGEAEISPYTLRNINENAELTDMMLPSEISRYFRRIITGRRIGEALVAFREVVLRLFPVLRQQIDFDQKSDYQEYTLYEHTAKAVGYGFPDYAVRLALLLHGIGKPDCAADRGDYNTYYGHSERGVMLARDAFEEYDAEDGIVDRVLFLIAHHDDHISPDNITDFITAFGAENTRLLLLMQSANIRAKSSDPVNERVSNSLRQLADNINSYAPPPNSFRNLRGRLGR